MMLHKLKRIFASDGNCERRKLFTRTNASVSDGKALIFKSHPITIAMVLSTLAWVIGALVLAIGGTNLSLPLIRLGGILIGVGFGVILGYSLSERRVQDSTDAL
jgi:hypothetical protein